MVNSTHLNPTRGFSILILAVLLYIFVDLQIPCSPVHLHFKLLQDASLTLHSRIFCPNSPALQLKESGSDFSPETVKSTQDSYIYFTTLPNHVHCSTYYTVQSIKPHSLLSQLRRTHTIPGLRTSPTQIPRNRNIKLHIHGHHLNALLPIYSTHGYTLSPNPSQNSLTVPPPINSDTES